MIFDYAPHTVALKQLSKDMEQACIAKEWDKALHIHMQICYETGKLLSVLYVEAAKATVNS